MENTEKKLYKTKDLTFAATLATCGVPCVGILDIQWRGVKGTPVGWFAFEEVPEIAELWKVFKSPLRPPMVHPITLHEEMKSLKTMVDDAAR